MPRYDNVFGGGNFDADDIDEWLTVQRDWQIDAGMEPAADADVARVRERAARAVQAVFDALEFPAISDAEIEAAVWGYDSRDLPDRDRAADVEAADRVLETGVTGLDVARALDEHGFPDVAEAVLGMQRLRVAADYLQTAAIVGEDWSVRSAISDPNAYTGPGTGYRLEGERWRRLRAVPHEVASLEVDPHPPGAVLVDRGAARRGARADEVVVAVGPAFLSRLRATIGGLPHEAVLAAVVDGVRAGGAVPRIVRVRRTADVAFIAHDAALLSGSGIGVGVQAKGTTVIHRADLEPLDNLELFGMAPLLTLDSYATIGRNAAAYALGRSPHPVPTEIDNFARAKLIVRTTLMHAAETEEVEPGAAPVELGLELVARST
jgi:hypothetical protein